MVATPRRSRLQVSLRMLLSLMVVVGAVLTIFRWPWVQRSEQEVFLGVYAPFDSWGLRTLRLQSNQVSAERRTTYRRNWRAEAVKHGVEQVSWQGILRYEAHFYEGQFQGPRRVFGKDGLLTIEAHYREGRLHGPFRAGDGTNWLWEGNYRNDQMHGPWRALLARQPSPDQQPPTIDDWFQADGTPFNSPAWFALPDEPIVVESNWERGKRQGRWTTKNLAGEVLNVAEYDQNELVRWNGEPVVAQLREWLTSPAVNNQRLANLLCDRYSTVELNRLQSGDLYLRMSGERNQHAAVLIHSQSDPLREYWHGAFNNHPNPCPAAILCEWAAVQGYGFQYRYGSLWLVSRGDPDPPFVDPTGVADIEFPAGSPMAREWNEVIDVHGWPGTAASCSELLLLNSSLPYDVAAIAEPLDLETFELLRERPPAKPPMLVCRRSRRDALGLVLYRTGCRCELRDGKLVILPRAGRTADERQRRPLGNFSVIGFDFRFVRQ